MLSDIYDIFEWLAEKLLLPVFILFFVWQPALNLFPSLVFNIWTDYPTIGVFVSLLYLLWVVLALIFRKFWIAAFLLLLFFLQTSHSYNEAAIFDFIENSSHLVYGYTFIAILVLSLPTYFKMNKPFKILYWGVILWLAMYAVLKSFSPIFIGMHYHYDLGIHIQRLAFVIIMSLPMFLALIYAANSVESYSLFAPFFYSLGIAYCCELLPQLYIISKFTHALIIVIYIYLAYNTSKCFLNWFWGDVSEIQVPAMRMREVLNSKTTAVCLVVVSSALIFFASSSALMLMIK